MIIYNYIYNKCLFIYGSCTLVECWLPRLAWVITFFVSHPYLTKQVCISKMPLGAMQFSTACQSQNFENHI